MSSLTNENFLSAFGVDSLSTIVTLSFFSLYAHINTIDIIKEPKRFVDIA